MVKAKAIVLDNNGKVMYDRSMLALSARGKIGRGGGFGVARFSYALYGGSAAGGRVYRRAVSGYNRYGKSATKRRRTHYVGMKYYRPTNPQTPAQQEQRAKMTAAVAEWNVLTAVEKSRYNERGKRANKIGRNLFISWYLKNH